MSSITPKKEGIEKVNQDSFNLSLTSSDPSSFPITYDDDMWVVVTEDSSLYSIMGSDGQFSQHQINEELAKIGIEGGGTEVEANPTGDAIDTLEKIKIGKTIYEIPQNISNTGLLYGGVVYPESEITPDVNCYYVVASTGYYESFDVTVHDYEKLPYLSYDAANDLWIVEYFDVYTYAYAHGKFDKVTELGESTIQVDSSQNFTNAERLQALANVSNQEAEYDGSTPPIFTGKMGYVVLQPESNATTTFAAQIADKPNTIFEIRDVFDLHDEPVSVPDNCTLKFNGGMLKNGILNGTPYIDANTNGVLGDVVVHGVANEKTELSWFLADGISVKYAIENACVCAHNSKNFILDGNNIEVTLLNTVNITENNDCNMQNLNIKFVPTADNQNMLLCDTTSMYQAKMTFIKNCYFEVLVKDKTHIVEGNSVAYRNINCIHLRKYDITTRGLIDNVFVKGFSGYMFICESYLQEFEFNRFKGSFVGGFISFNREYDSENLSPFGDYAEGSSNILTFNQCGIDNGIDINNDIQDIVSLSKPIFLNFQSCVFQGNGYGKICNLYYMSRYQGISLYAKFNQCWREFVGQSTKIDNIIVDAIGATIVSDSYGFASEIDIRKKGVCVVTSDTPEFVISEGVYPKITLDLSLTQYTKITDYIEKYKDVADLSIESKVGVDVKDVGNVRFKPYLIFDAKKDLISKLSTSAINNPFEVITENGVEILRQAGNAATDRVYLCSNYGDNAPFAYFPTYMVRIVFRTYPLSEVTESNVDSINTRNNKVVGDQMRNDYLLFISKDKAITDQDDKSLFKIGQSTNPEDNDWREIVTPVKNFVQSGNYRDSNGDWGMDIAVFEVYSQNYDLDYTIMIDKDDNTKLFNANKSRENVISTISKYTPNNGECIGMPIFDISRGIILIWNGSDWVDTNGNKPYSKVGLYANKPTFASGTNVGAEYFATDIGNGLKIIWNGSDWHDTNGNNIPTYRSIINNTTSGKGITLSNMNQVLDGNTFETNVVSQLGLKVTDITVTMGDTEVQGAFDETTQKITVTNVNDDVVVTGGDLVPNELKFVAKQANSSIQLTTDGTPGYTPTLEISEDGSTWNSYTIGDIITLQNIDDFVMFRGNNVDTNGKCKFTVYTSNIENTDNYVFVIQGNVECYGDITALCNNIGGNIPLTMYAFTRLFKNCASIVKAPNLPSAELALGCYRDMFETCTGLTETPILVAQTVQAGSYYKMFYGCSHIEKVITYMTDISAASCLLYWLVGVASSGGFYCNQDLNIISGYNGIPNNWTRYNLDDTPWVDPNAE